MSKPRSKRSSLIPVLIAVIVLLAGGWAYNTIRTGTTTPVNILLMGLDEGKVRTDVVVLAHIDPQQKLINLLSVPRDTLVEIDCQGSESCVSPDKLAHAHAYGGEDGPAWTIKAVEGLLGVKIDHYVRVDFDGFEEVVNSLGGVDIVIEQDMDYEDPYAHPPLKIHFNGSPEPQHLDGHEALGYVRFRSDNRGDIGRTERTKRFLVALAKKAKSSQSITKLPGVVTGILPYVKTDIDSATAVALAKSAVSFDLDQTQMATLPGFDDRENARGWVWVADQEKMAEVVDRLILNPKPPAAAEAEPAKK